MLQWRLGWEHVTTLDVRQLVVLLDNLSILVVIQFAFPQIGNEEQTTLMEGLLFQTTYSLCKESKNSPVHYVAFEGNLLLSDHYFVFNDEMFGKINNL